MVQNETNDQIKYIIEAHPEFYFCLKMSSGGVFRPRTMHVEVDNALLRVGRCRVRVPGDGSCLVSFLFLFNLKKHFCFLKTPNLTILL